MGAVSHKSVAVLWLFKNLVYWHGSYSYTQSHRYFYEVPIMLWNLVYTAIIWSLPLQFLQHRVNPSFLLSLLLKKGMPLVLKEGGFFRSGNRFIFACLSLNISWYGFKRPETRWFLKAKWTACVGRSKALSETPINFA